MKSNYDEMETGGRVPKRVASAGRLDVLAEAGANGVRAANADDVPRSRRRRRDGRRARRRLDRVPRRLRLLESPNQRRGDGVRVRA